MPKLITFSKIGQFRNILEPIQNAARFQGLDEDGEPIYDLNIPIPTITFEGTVKLNGTNASVVCDMNSSELWCQSRRNVITPASDNHGFAFFAQLNEEIFRSFFEDILKYKIPDCDINCNNQITIFGEWCGSGIQSGVAVSQLPKMFVIFGVKITGEGEEGYYLKPQLWKHLYINQAEIYNIYNFPTFSIDIDFADPRTSQNKLIEYTESVEKCCPVGKHFGVTGTGEGVVWTGWYKNRQYTFKVKGEKHSVTKVKKLASIDPEKLASIKEFVDYAVTENRLIQAIEQVFVVVSETPDIKKTGAFLKWIKDDVFTEELDTLAANGLEPKDVVGRLSQKAKDWFFEYLNQTI